MLMRIKYPSEDKAYIVYGLGQVLHESSDVYSMEAKAMRIQRQKLITPNQAADILVLHAIRSTNVNWTHVQFCATRPLIWKQRLHLELLRIKREAGPAWRRPR